MLLATSLALWTNCLLATGLDVLEEARRQALHNAEVCLATIVAAERTLGALNTGVICDDLKTRSKRSYFDPDVKDNEL